MKPVVVRARADEDIDRAIEHGSTEYPLRVGALIDAFEATFRRAGRQPAAGSPRYAHELQIEGLRTLATPKFPYLVFYVDTPKAVVILRVLHQKRDIPARLTE